MDLDGISAVSELSQAERVESVMVDQRSLEYVPELIFLKLGVSYYFKNTVQ